MSETPISIRILNVHLRQKEKDLQHYEDIIKDARLGNKGHAMLFRNYSVIAIKDINEAIKKTNR